MKRLVSALLPLFLAVCALGQNGNEWIDYSRTYIKISVGRDGLYRIPYQSLQQEGFDVASDPRGFRLFHRGTEQAIYIEGEGDGIFDPGDYVEFYGRRNDGTLDSTLYSDPAHQPHRYYNLYSDTSAYFLTVGSSPGKRMRTYERESQGLNPETFHYAERLLVMTQSYSGGVDYGNALLSTFDKGEGWMSVQILQGQQADYTISNVIDTSPSSGKPTLEVMLTGRGPMNHDVEILAGNRLLSRVSFQGFDSHVYSGVLEWTDIDAGGNCSITVRVTGASGPDRVSTGYVRLVFPQKTTLSGTAAIFTLRAGQEPSLLEIEDAPPESRVFDVTDPASPVRIASTSNGTLHAVVDRDGDSRKVLVTSEVTLVSSVKNVTFRPLDPSSFNYVVITHPLLRRAASGYADPVKAFAAYRNHPEGGGYDTLVLNIGQLYDQFNYGETSPRAIYQFLRFCATEKLPDYLFLIGKGLTVNYGYWRNPNAFTVYRDLVPTAGFPASDMLFSTGLTSGNVPAVATGRLTANKPEDVATYLNKVKEHDARAYTDLSRKKILHLSGGIEESEPLLFRQILESYQAVAEDLYLGGRVQAIAKRSTNIKLINIADEVNRGVGMITFFGHSAPTTTDFDIGFVSDPVLGYNNAKKYPFMFMNGCDAGSFFLNTSIIGENWVMTPDKGAIGFIAHSAYGLLYNLQAYASTFYDVAFADSLFISKGAGVVQREVAIRFLQAYGSSASQVSQAQQMVLLGDPVIPIFGAAKPDYVPIQENFAIRSFTDEPVTAFSDSFRIEIPIRNYGIARPENIRVNIRREYGGGQLLEYDTIIPSILYEDVVSMTIRNPAISGYGINIFTVHVDADNLIEELNEENNIATFEYFIALNSTRNLFPYNNAIVARRDVSLAFQFTDPSSAARDFILEIDTTRNFDSSFKQRFSISAPVLARQSLRLPAEDSTVYFWRTRIANPLDDESREWNISSFSYIDGGPEGWAQLHFQQYEKNPAVGLVSDPAIRRLEFEETASDLAIRTFASSASKPLDSVSLRINGVEFNLLHEQGRCRDNTINLVAFDRRSTQPYPGIYFKWYELLYQYGGRRLLCGREPYVINSFTPQELVTGNDDDLIRYIDNIAAGDTVMLFNFGNAGYAQWPAVAKQKLQELGISGEQLAVFQNGDAMVIFGRKGSAAGTAEIHHAAQGSVDVDRTIAGRFTNGSISSGLIGPAQRWEKLVTQVSEVEEVDGFSFSVIGVTADGAEDILKTGVHAEEDISFVDAIAYPYIRMQFEMSDDLNLTAVQLAKWLVLYEPFAEGMIYHRSGAHQPVVSEGEIVYSDFGFVNVSDKVFRDSLLVRFDLVNHVRDAFSSSFRISAPPPGDSTLFTIPVNTIGRGGLNDLQVFVNPRIIPETKFDNNLVFLPEYVNVLIDRSAPVLDVTFDGRYLRDNDFVSANPAILIRMWDENTFMPKTDTVGVKIFMAHPCALDVCGFESVYFRQNDVRWYPATDISDFKVLFTPRDLPTGEYRLRVNAEDGSGNAAGELPYEIRFRVDREQRLVVTSAYPNPFSWQTSFDVLVTGGSAVPTFYELRVSTVNGRLVAEQRGLAEDFHIGLNTITWNSTASDGRPLSGGVYYYQLYIYSEGEQKVYFGKIIKI